ncbi:dihydrodipicolinate synthase family protein [Candidatus Pelagibacter sp.]|nr:dihydrodipicolinate synthase family protein [Candidatus Pelagibacter sp.]
MSKIKGIYAATLSILNEDLSLNIEKTILHAENIINQGCHGVAFFGSTGQAQLIPVSEKINLLNSISTNKNKDKFIVGTGLNSLVETINFMKVAISLNFRKFLIMPPAYYKYGDKEVVSYYTKIIEEVPDAEIILYNFEKLSGYKFSINCVEELAKKFPKQIIGVKDSSYNLFENLKIDNFSVLPGSENKLLKGLQLGCDGIITATCNITATLTRKVYDDFIHNKDQSLNEKLCKVRTIFDGYNLISAIHSLMAQIDKSYSNILPPLSILNSKDCQKLIEDLKKIDFNYKN